MLKDRDELLEFKSLPRVQVAVGATDVQGPITSVGGKV